MGQDTQNSTGNFSFAKFKVSTGKIQLSLPLMCKIIQTHTREVFLPMVSKHFDFVFFKKKRGIDCKALMHRNASGLLLLERLA